jgi:YegS/Rv2252/BmrU family lipid kinase
MTQKRYKIILNPVAGKGRAGERAGEIEAMLTQRGIRHDIVLTKAVGHAIELAREARQEGFDTVVAAGGDGTVNEVVNGLMQCAARDGTPPSLGVLSVGRGNDFSYGADIPPELEACVEVLAAGKERPMDVGRIAGGYYPEGRFFANGIGAGFDTIVGLEAAKMKHVHGFMAYVFGAARTFIMYPAAPHVIVTLDGGAGGVFEQKSHQISIMNGRRMGGTFFMAPKARNWDGAFDLCMAAELTRGQMVDLIGRYTKGSQAGRPGITCARAAHYAIEAPEGGLVVHADGETICTDGHSLDIACLPSALRLIYSEGMAASFESSTGKNE